MANLAVSKFLGVKPLLVRESHMRLLESLWRQRPSTLLPDLEVPLLLLLADTGGDTLAVTKDQAERAEAHGADVEVVLTRRPRPPRRAAGRDRRRGARLRRRPVR